jgi:hypothetical protein
MMYVFMNFSTEVVLQCAHPFMFWHIPIVYRCSGDGVQWTLGILYLYIPEQNLQLVTVIVGAVVMVSGGHVGYYTYIYLQQNLQLVAAIIGVVEMVSGGHVEPLP